MSSNVSNTSRITLVLQDPEQLKTDMKANTDKVIEKSGEMCRGGLNVVVKSLPSAAPVVSTVIIGAIASKHPGAAMAADPAIDSCVKFTTEYSAEASTPSIDPSVDSSVASSKNLSHRSIDASVDSMNSCLQVSEEKVNSLADSVFSC